MSSSTSGTHADWPAWEAVLRRFEEDWRRPEPPELADYLPAPSTYPLRLVAELAQIDLEFRWRRGERPAVEDYLGRFPELRQEELLFDLILSEVRQRRRHGSPAELSDLQARFPALAARLAQAFADPIATHSAAGAWLRPDPPAPPPKIAGVAGLREIGRGGMGVVYQAHQPALDRIVAVKTLAVLHRPEAGARFRREAEAMARLDHPNLVPIYEVGECLAEGSGVRLPYFIMKWLPGGSLADAPAGPGSDPRRQAQLVEAVSRAVHHAHQRGVLHRDLKPSNILLDEKGEPHVADFGLAGRFDPADPRSLTTEVVGTPAFMAPEQARAPSQVSTAADVYGLGALLYYLLAGQPPFEGETALATLEQATQTEAPPPSKLNPATPRDLDLICLKCLRKEPSRRYASAAALADDLAAWRAGDPISARPAAAGERVRAWARRRPRAAGLAGGLALALAAAFAAFVYSYSRIRDQETVTAQALREETQAKGRLAETLRGQERQLYVERVAGAGRMFELNQLPRCAELLDACPPALRGWEWRYLDKQRRLAPLELAGHGAWINSAVYLPNGDLATGDVDGTVILWRPREQKQLRRWKVGAGPVSCLASSPDGRWLAIATASELSVWKVEDGRLAKQFAGAGWCAFSPKGDRLAAANHEFVAVHRVGDWTKEADLEGHQQGPIRGAFAPDGTLHTAGGDQRARRWDLATMKEVGLAQATVAPVRALAVAADGIRLIEAFSGEAGAMAADTGKNLGRIDLPLAERVALAAAPKTNRVALNGPAGEAFLWDLDERCLVRTLRGHGRLATALAFSANERWLATAGGDGLVRVWDLTADPEVAVLASAADHEACLSAAPDGATLALSPRALGRPDQDFVRLLGVGDGRERRRLPGFGAAAFAEDGRLVALAEKDAVALYDRASGERLRGFSTQGLKLVCVALSRDGRWLAAGDLKGNMRWWELREGGAAGALRMGARPIFALAFHPHAPSLFVAGGDALEKVDLPTQIRTKLDGASGAFALACAPDGRLLATADSDKLIRLRDGATGQTVRPLDGHYQHVMAVAFSPDGSRLISGGVDRTLRLWDAASGKELLKLPGLARPPVAVAWLPGRDAIVALDNAVRLWRLED